MKRTVIYPVLKKAVFQILPAFLILPATFPCVALPASEKGQDQMKAIESRLTREKEKFREFHTQEKDLLLEITTLEKEVQEKRRGIKSAEERVGEVREQADKLGETLEKSERILRRAENRLAERLVALYKYTRQGYVTILTDVNDLNAFRKRLKYLKTIMTEDRRMLNRLSAEKNQKQMLVDGVRVRLTEKEKEYQGAIGRLKTLREELENKVIRLMKIHKEKEFYEIAVKELELAAENLKATLAAIEKKEMEKMKWASMFQGARGKLPLPLEGRLIRPNDFLKSIGARFQKGIFIEGNQQRDVRAVYPGRVDYSGHLKGYGEIVILNHGSRFFTIHAHITHRKKKVGEVVQAGDVICLAARTEPGNHPRLYFEIRKGDRSLDPFKWLKLKK